MNSSNTSETIRMLFSSHLMSLEFYPPDASWINCITYTYHPHSNECGPRTLLALSFMALHPHPHHHMILPYMHPNLAQISRWWVANTILCDQLHIPSISMYFQQVSPIPNILQKDTYHTDLATLHNAQLDLTQDATRKTLTHSLEGQIPQHSTVNDNTTFQNKSGKNMTHKSNPNKHLNYKQYLNYNKTQIEFPQFVIPP